MGPKRILLAIAIIVVATGCSKSKTTNQQKSDVPAPSMESGPVSEHEQAQVNQAPPSQPASTSYSEFMFAQQRVAKAEIRKEHFPAGGSASFTTFTCKRGSRDCRNRLVSVGSNKGHCTGVLIKKDVVLTNRHCLQDWVTKPFSDFESVVVSLPQNSQNSNPKFVSAIVMLSPVEFQVNGLKADYAFLKLYEPITEVQPVKMNFSGVKNGETYTVYGVSPFGNARNPDEVFPRRCKAVYKAGFAPHFDNAFDPVIMFADCPIGPSNSGSPVYNDDGELVALIAGQFSPTLVSVLNSLGVVLGVLPTTVNLNPVGWGTNLACIPDINRLLRKIPEACNADFVEAPKVIEIPSELSQQLTAALESQGGGSQKYHYKVVRANEENSVGKFITQNLYLRIPSCVKADALHSIRSPNPVELKISAATITKNWELTGEISDVREQEFEVQFDASQLSAGGASTELTIRLQNMTVHTDRIGVCGG